MCTGDPVAALQHVWICECDVVHESALVPLLVDTQSAAMFTAFADASAGAIHPCSSMWSKAGCTSMLEAPMELLVLAVRWYVQWCVLTPCGVTV